MGVDTSKMMTVMRRSTSNSMQFAPGINVGKSDSEGRDPGAFERQLMDTVGLSSGVTLSEERVKTIKDLKNGVGCSKDTSTSATGSTWV